MDKEKNMLLPIDFYKDKVFSGFPPSTEEERKIRRAFNLPVTKQLVYYINRHNQEGRREVKEFSVVECFTATYTWYTLEVIMTTGEKRKVHSDFFKEMQSPTFISDMEKQAGL